MVCGCGRVGEMCMFWCSFDGVWWRCGIGTATARRERRARGRWCWWWIWFWLWVCLWIWWLILCVCVSGCWGWMDVVRWVSGTREARRRASGCFRARRRKAIEVIMLCRWGLCECIIVKWIWKCLSSVIIRLRYWFLLNCLVRNGRRCVNGSIWNGGDSFTVIVAYC